MMTSSQHVYEIRPRKDKRGVDLISDVLPFGRMWIFMLDRSPAFRLCWLGSIRYFQVRPRRHVADMGFRIGGDGRARKLGRSRQHEHGNASRRHQRERAPGTGPMLVLSPIANCGGERSVFGFSPLV